MFASLISFVDPSVSFNLNLDLIKAKKPITKAKVIQQKKKAREKASSVIMKSTGRAC